MCTGFAKKKNTQIILLSPPPPPHLLNSMVPGVEKIVILLKLNFKYLSGGGGG